jgi:hypothetical protein
VPEVADLCLLRDGAAVARGHGRELSARVDEPGAYRIEAWRGERVWILDNPIYLRERDGDDDVE